VEGCYVRTVGKVTSALASKLDEADDDGLLEIVVELAGPAAPAAVERGDRRAAMEAMKEGFRAAADPVEQAIRSGGGEVTGKAWINNTLRARVPAKSLPRIVEQASVTAVDVPKPLEPES
jgi:hypothetical protein